MPAALGLQVLFGLLTNISASSKRPPEFFCAKHDICKDIFQPSIYGKSLQHPKKNLADDHLGKHLYAKVFHPARVAFHVVMFQV